MSGDLRARLSDALRPAMRARDAAAVSALRSALGAVANAEAVPVSDAPSAGALEEARVGVGAADAPRRELTEDDVRRVVHAEVAEREGAAEVLAGHARHDEAARLRAEAAVLRAHLDA
ncbi:GatB/YqeY domain-containing protein [Phycicoccus sonneratiae]|uniref:GatB/YqeY domain-containing protein n=1 Tax=Phycicoccus sonneratiae TaxID=2807628 RepID=A0ABS2CP47_9MICO|nr:GatB/YqeY domain-containing protein [Phycicoccus sonneraticus]MBM6401656.1 GatB/YqeY domain-containing protein [Phycicoccus sonneraticus]